MKASIAVSTCGTAILFLALTGCSAAGPAPNASSSAAPSASESRTIANYFRVGDCIRDPLEGATSVTLVDCAKPHSAEVYAIFMLPDGPFPGNGKAADVKKQCGGAARTIFSPEVGNDPTLRTTVRFPDQGSWAQGDRSVTCIVTSSAPRTGSIPKA